MWKILNFAFMMYESGDKNSLYDEISFKNCLPSMLFCWQNRIRTYLPKVTVCRRSLNSKRIIFTLLYWTAFKPYLCTICPLLDTILSDFVIPVTTRKERNPHLYRVFDWTLKQGIHNDCTLSSHCGSIWICDKKSRMSWTHIVCLELVAYHNMQIPKSLYIFS